MSYVLPALRVHQEFEAIANATDNRLYACIIAPQYGLHRYSEEDEKASLGAYDSDAGSVFTPYPDKAAGSVIDVPSNRVYMENSALRYTTQSLAGGPTDGLLEDNSNKVRCDSLVLKTANDEARSAVFGSRDVQVGDPIRVTPAAGTPVLTSVSGLIADQDDDTVQAAPDAVNAGTTDGGSATPDYSGITDPLISVAASLGSYDGLADGVLIERYTVTVKETAGGLTNSVVDIISDSGLDDVLGYILGSGTVPLGARGASSTITLGGGSLAVGDSYFVDVVMDYTVPAPSAAGPYSGLQDTKYIVKVTQGGTIGVDDPVVQVFTDNGSDSGEATPVTALGAYTVGHFGVSITFAAGDEQLVKGAEFTIDVTAAGAGAVRTLVLADALAGVAQATALSVEFMLPADYELEPTQWTSDATSVTIAAGAVHEGNYLGVDQSFDVINGDAYIDYRELLDTYNNVVSSVQTPEEASLVCGPAVEENPLGLLVNKALTNSAGVEVYFITTAGEADSDYEDAIDALTTVPQVYSLVPYSNSLAVRDALKTHCLSMSSPEKGQWRIWWISAETDRDAAVYDNVSGATLQAAILGAGGVPGTSPGTAPFNRVVSTQPGVDFLAAGVEAGDTWRTNYQTDAYGVVTYDEYVVDQVGVAELVLLSGPATAQVTEVKGEAWHNMSLSEYADAISLIATHSNNRRGYAIWSEPVYDGNNPDGMSLSAVCAAAAGLRSGVAPHRPLTNVTLDGFTMTRTVNFRETQLNTMAGNGIWLVVQTLEGEVYNRHQVSTDNDDINMREQTITTNLDHICRDFKAAFANFYGRGNVSPEMLKLIRYTAEQQFTVIMSRPYPDTIGPQLLEAVITRLEVNPVLRDQVDLVIVPTLPYPLNNLDIYFIIS